MYSISNDTTFDADYGPHSPFDTLPLPAEVEREFIAHTGGDVKAWFAERGIDAAPIGKIIEHDLVWNPETRRYHFIIDGPHTALAVPIYEDGKFIDLLLIGDDLSFEMACCRASWLGRANLAGPVVRLHAHPLDWLEAGCTGACHIEPISRKALKGLQAATTIECNDIGTALEAWSWGFGAEDEELARFSIDDTHGNIRSYFEDEVKWYAMRTAIDVGAHR